jgi:hypothetical protein
MATITVDTQYTLAEMLRRTAPDGSPLRSIAQVLDQVNDAMKIIPTFEANGVNLHKEAETKTEPSGSYTDYNEHVSRVASRTKANEFRLAKLEAFNTPDKNLIDDSPDPQGKRMQEATATLKGMMKTVASDLIYGNSASDSKKFTGIAAYVDDTDQSNVVDGGGTGSDLTSIYVIAPGPDTVFWVHPKGNPSFGVEHEDMGTDIISDASTNTKDLRVYRDYFKFHQGLVVKDRRAVGRYANIESSGSSNIFDEDKLIDLNTQMLEFSDSIFYLVNRTIMAQMWKRVKDKNNVFLDINEAFGKPVITLFGRPVLLHDKIVDTETAVTS